MRDTHAEANVLVTCTHTHHGPDTIGLWGSDSSHSGVDVLYMATLTETIVALAHEAFSTLRPAAVRVGSVDVPGVAKNARDPEIVDIELSCIQFVDAKTSDVLSTWLTFPCHPEVLWDDNPCISADYVAAMRDTVASATGGPCLATVGALGGMMTPDMPGHTFGDAEAMGAKLGNAALTELDDGEAVSVDQVTHMRCSASVPLDNPLFLMASQAGLVPELMEDGAVPVEASLLKLGGTWLFAVPGELFPKLGLAYKKMMLDAGADQAVIIGLANDELGYILPAEDFVVPTDWQEPGESYEESMSVSVQMGPKLTDILKKLIGSEA